jgi:hypothetical protein
MTDFSAASRTGRAVLVPFGATARRREKLLSLTATTSHLRRHRLFAPVDLSDCPNANLKLRMSQVTHIQDVWAFNLEEEMAKIRELVENYPMVAMVRSAYHEPSF